MTGRLRGIIALLALLLASFPGNEAQAQRRSSVCRSIRGDIEAQLERLEDLREERLQLREDLRLSRREDRWGFERDGRDWARKDLRELEEELRYEEDYLRYLADELVFQGCAPRSAARRLPRYIR